MEDYLHTRGNSDWVRFRILGVKTFIEDAVWAYKRALGVSQKAFRHEIGAAESLIDRYRTFLEPANIDAALKYAKDAGEHCPPGDGKLEGECHRVEGPALVSLFHVRRLVDLLKDAVGALEDATTLIPRKSQSPKVWRRNTTTWGLTPFSKDRS